MKHNGAVCLSRIAAFLLTAMICITTCLTPAYADSIWNELVLSLRWMNANGQEQSATAQPVPQSTERAYWVNVDPSAMYQTLTVEAYSPNPA